MNLAVGRVTLCFSPVSTESRNRPTGSLEESLSLIARNLLSGDQARQLLPCIKALFQDSLSFRSGPPRAGTNKTASFSLESLRTKAMERPSGDHAGLKSSAG